MNTTSAYDAAEKPPRPTAPPMDSPAQRQSAAATRFAPPEQQQPQREPSASSLYYTAPQATAYSHQPPLPPMPPMPPMAAQQSGYFQPAQAQAPPKYDTQYLPPPPPPAHGYVEDDYEEEDSSFHAFLKETGRLALFHALNGLLGYVAFSVCVGGVAMSVSLLPLCCFGIVVFRVLLYAVYGFAQLDVMLYNFITPPEDHVFVQVPPNARAGAGISGHRLAPTLADFSPLSLMALIYFCSVKFLLSTLSSVCVSLAVTAPLSLVFAVLGLGHGPVFSVQLGPEDIADFGSQPLAFLLATACLFVIGVALMHLVAKASREATRFFCCEQFSTYRYVHHPSQSQLLYPPMAAPGQPPQVPPPPYAYGAIPSATPMDPYAHGAPQTANGNGSAVVIRFNAGGV